VEFRNEPGDAFPLLKIRLQKIAAENGEPLREIIEEITKVTVKSEMIFERNGEIKTDISEKVSM
jgi:hypothetical protein